VARILILAGTTEATQLAARLVADGHDVTSSLAGVTTSPVDRAGRVRRGGFGGAAGLARHLVDHGIEVMVDATHPFAAVMPFNAATSAATTGVAHCRLLRPPWRPADGDRWHPAASLDHAATELPTIGATRVFLTVGRQGLGAFAGCSGVWFLVRAIEPVPAVLPGAQVVLGRGPFAFEDELELLNTHRIDTLVVKNSGGAATASKLDAARRLGLAVVVVQRPAQPEVETFAGVTEVVTWCRRRVG
jgi:precorrin-6A/cobalt-precorrin-6A reductase